MKPHTRAYLPPGTPDDKYANRPSWRFPRVLGGIALLALIAGGVVTPAALTPSTQVKTFTYAGTTIVVPKHTYTATITVPTVTGPTKTVTVTTPAAPSPTTTTTTSSSPPPPASVWQWNAAAATLDAGSATKVAAFQNYALAAGTYFEAAVAWVNAPAGTPAYTIPITGQSIKSITAPVPIGTKPGNTFDQSLTVHAADGTDYDFGLAQYSTSTGKLGSTDGAAPVPAGSAYETGPGSGNAARFPLRQGPITPADVASGVINHPLVISIPNVGPAPNPYPANTTVGYPANTGVPLGTWLRLDPAVDVSALGLPHLETEIAVAMQRYGMFVRDIGSTLCVIATDQVNQGGNAVDWPAVGVTLTSSTPAGVPYARSLSSKFPWSHLQVLRPPTP